MTTATLRAMKATDEARFDVAPSLDSALFLDLAAATAYWVEALAIINVASSYAHVINSALVYDGLLDDDSVHVMRSQGTCGYASTYVVESRQSELHLSQAGLETTDYNWNSTGSNSSTATRGLIWWRGRITTQDAGRFGLSWGHAYNGYGPAYSGRVIAGSWLYATPLDICPV